jgi:hypothetical protein
MPAGRPSTYDPAYCERVIELGALGKSQVQISAEIDIPRTTMLSWADVHPEFSTALTRAKELEQAWWENQAQNNLSVREFNAALWSKNVASRFRSDYGDRMNVDHGVQDSLADLMREVDGKTRGLPNGS